MRLRCIWLFWFLFTLSMSGQDGKTDKETVDAEKVTLKGKTVLAWIGGQFEEAEKTISLPHQILVKTNGVFTVRGRKEHNLQEGDIIDHEGMLTTRGGRMRPLLDHITQDRGQVVLSIDNQPRPLAEPYRLPNGMIVLPSGWIDRPGRPRMRLFDGQILLLDGKIQETKDTVTKKDGRVLVQKEGAQLEIQPRRSIVMNDGTRVFGDGRIRYPDGRTAVIKENEVIYLEGAKRSLP